MRKPITARRSSKANALSNLKSNPLSSVLSVDRNGILQQKGGFIYSENSSGDLVQVFFTDNLDNLQPIVKSTTREDIAQGQPLQKPNS